jgi:hydroxyethylthiazole kinase-like sugar kinase family protein
MIEPDSTPTTEKTTASIGDTAQRAWQATKDKTSDALHAGEEYVREHPTTSVLGIFGLGCLLGAVIGWSIAHETHDSYTDRALKLAKRLGGKFNLD